MSEDQNYFPQTIQEVADDKNIVPTVREIATALLEARVIAAKNASDIASKLFLSSSELNLTSEELKASLDPLTNLIGTSASTSDAIMDSLLKSNDAFVTPPADYYYEDEDDDADNVAVVVDAFDEDLVELEPTEVEGQSEAVSETPVEAVTS